MHQIFRLKISIILKLIIYLTFFMRKHFWNAKINYKFCLQLFVIKKCYIKYIYLKNKWFFLSNKLMNTSQTFVFRYLRVSHVLSKWNFIWRSSNSFLKLLLRINGIYENFRSYFICFYQRASKAPAVSDMHLYIYVLLFNIL